MTTLRNEITIHAPIEKIWQTLTEVETLDKYDPTVRKSTAQTAVKKGMGASRKVEMLDGKNWFEETCTEAVPNKALTYELTACSFPIHKLKHSYSFKIDGDRVKVCQTMEYSVKLGSLGKSWMHLSLGDNRTRG
jgi:uncharacterized protein YndB with AHSA1/START domain